MLPLQKKNVSNNDRMEVFSTDIHPEKKHFYQQFPGYASTVRKSVMHFQAIWKLEFQFFFLRYLPLGIPHGGISFTF